MTFDLEPVQGQTLSAGYISCDPTATEYQLKMFLFLINTYIRHSSRSWSQLVTIFLKKFSFLPERLLYGSLTFISQQIPSGLKKNTFWTCLNYFWILKTTLKGEKWGKNSVFSWQNFKNMKKKMLNFSPMNSLTKRSLLVLISTI